MRRSIGRRVFSALSLSLLLIVTACSSGAAPTVSVAVGDQQMDVQATQYCLDGQGKRYAVTPQILQVAPEETIRIDVPEEVAHTGWSFQVYGQSLSEGDLIGEVQVGKEASYELSTSDAVPQAYFIVIVQASGDLCDGLAGAWPIGFLRASG